MASIVPYENGYRAHIYVAGRRESRTFRTRAEAKEWARTREAELDRDRGPDGPAVTFGEMAEEWLRRKLPKLTSAKNQGVVEASLRNHMLPKLKDRPLADITRMELVAVVEGIVTEKAPRDRIETARRVGGRIREIFDLAHDQGYIPETHPASKPFRGLPSRVKRHMNRVTAPELPSLLQAIDCYPSPMARLGLMLMAHTFLRTNELIGGMWSELVDGDPIWVVPGERMKVKRKGSLTPHVVPLSKQALAILEELREVNGDTPYILAGATRLTPIHSNTLINAIYNMGYKGRMTGHGFRGVASTILNGALKWPSDVIERQLAHKEVDAVRDAYNKAEYLEQRRELMAWWGDYLEDALKTSTTTE